MRCEVHERESLEQWWRAGTLPGWVCAVVAAACVVTVTVAAAGARVVWEQVGRYVGVNRFHGGNDLAIGLALAIVVCVAAPGAVSRWVRMAVLLPVLQLLGMAVAWAYWLYLTAGDRAVWNATRLVENLPLSYVVAELTLLCSAAGFVIARRRMREWLHVATMIALVDLLLFGLWLPIVAPLVSARWSIPVVLLPPLVAAMLIAWRAHRDRWLFARRGTVFAAAVGVLFCVAAFARLEPSETALRNYTSFTHVLLATAAVAIAMLVALATTLHVRTRRARQAIARDALRLAGTIVTDDIVGRIEITSWLRGPELVVGPCSVTTARGEVLVPGGAELVAHVPPITTRLAVGESVVVLRGGDRVELAGYVRPAAAGHPFRDAAADALVPGPGVRIAPTDADRVTGGDVALAVWRPAVAYLLIVTAVAVPGVLTAFTMHGH
jgi:hypothetical protein